MGYFPIYVTQKLIFVKRRKKGRNNIAIPIIAKPIVAKAFVLFRGVLKKRGGGSGGGSGGG